MKYRPIIEAYIAAYSFERIACDVPKDECVSDTGVVTNYADADEATLDELYRLSQELSHYLTKFRKARRAALKETREWQDSLDDDELRDLYLDGLEADAVKPRTPNTADEG